MISRQLPGHAIVLGRNESFAGSDVEVTNSADVDTKFLSHGRDEEFLL